MLSPGESAGRAALPVYDGAEPIGSAASWAEVEALLVERGLTAAEAHAAVLTRGVPTRTAFHVIAAGTEQRMLADLRALRAQNA
jgi:hypothetical protein